MRAPFLGAAALVGAPIETSGTNKPRAFAMAGKPCALFANFRNWERMRLAESEGDNRKTLDRDEEL